MHYYVVVHSVLVILCAVSGLFQAMLYWGSTSVMAQCIEKQYMLNERLERDLQIRQWSPSSDCSFMA